MSPFPLMRSAVRASSSSDNGSTPLSEHGSMVLVKPECIPGEAPR